MDTVGDEDWGSKKEEGKREGGVLLPSGESQKVFGSRRGKEEGGGETEHFPWGRENFSTYNERLTEGSQTKNTDGGGSSMKKRSGWGGDGTGQD